MWGPLFLATVLLGLGLSAHVDPSALWAWKLQILSSEYGHLLALPSLALVAHSTLGLRRVRAAWLTTLMSVAATALLLRPLALAWRLDPAALDGVRLLGLRQDEGEGLPSRTLVYAQRDGVELALDLYQPLSIGKGPRPLLIVIHGGGWRGGDRGELPRFLRRMAFRGFAVASVDYRLAPAHPWPASIEDVGAALEFLKLNAASLGIDATRVAVLGRSAGGQIAETFAFKVRDPAIRAVVGVYAPADMVYAFRKGSDDGVLPSLRLIRDYMGSEEPTDAALRDASGLHLAHAGLPPVFLVHGLSDRLVFPLHSQRLAARLQELSVPVTLLELPWATHGFEYNQNGPGAQIYLRALDGFLSPLLAKK
jgi:acetyl esterase/lipase